MPRNVTTASQNHSGSSTARRRRSEKLAMPCSDLNRSAYVTTRWSRVEDLGQRTEQQRDVALPSGVPHAADAPHGGGELPHTGADLDAVVVEQRLADCC